MGLALDRPAPRIAPAEPERKPGPAQLSVWMDVEAFSQLALVRPGIALLMAVPGFRDMLRGSGIRPFVDLRLVRVSLHGLAPEQLTLAGVHSGGEQALLAWPSAIAAMRNRKPLLRGDAELRASAWEDGTGVDRGLAVHGGAFVIAARTALPGLLGTQQPGQQVPRLSSLRERVALQLTVEDASRYLPGMQLCGLQALRASIAASGERSRMALTAYYRTASAANAAPTCLGRRGAGEGQLSGLVKWLARAESAPGRNSTSLQVEVTSADIEQLLNELALGAAQCVAASHGVCVWLIAGCATTPPCGALRNPGQRSQAERRTFSTRFGEAAARALCQRGAQLRSRAAARGGAERRDARLRELSRCRPARRGSARCQARRQRSVEANLQRAQLASAYLANATLHAAQLERANLYQTVLWASDLSSAVLDGAQLDQANLEHADLSDARLHGASLKKTLLASAVLRGADLSGANLSGATLPDADLEGAKLTGANLSYANLGRAYLQGADLSAALLCGTVLPSSAADANLQGARYGKGTRLPPGFDAKAHGAVEDPCCAEKDFEGACAWNGPAGK